jgi:hypothetical protein
MSDRPDRARNISEVQTTRIVLNFLPWHRQTRDKFLRFGRNPKFDSKPPIRNRELFSEVVAAEVLLAMTNDKNLNAQFSIQRHSTPKPALVASGQARQ